MVIVDVPLLAEGSLTALKNPLGLNLAVGPKRFLGFPIRLAREAGSRSCGEPSALGNPVSTPGVGKGKLQKVAFHVGQPLCDDETDLGWISRSYLRACIGALLLTFIGPEMVKSHQDGQDNLEGRWRRIVFKFHEFLERWGYDPKHTRLLRHDARGARNWRRSPDSFLCFASFQTQANSPYNGPMTHACHFIAGPTIEGRATALFVGTTEVKNGRPWDRREEPSIQDQEVINAERSSPHALDLFDLTWCSACSNYVERILIDWGAGTRTWSQWAHRNDKDVLELRLDAHEAPFPGFGRFRERISSLEGLPQAWRKTLESVRGVYLLVTPDGRQYVGSASGMHGFMGRWREYSANGHGSNVKLMQLPQDQRDYQVSILETASPEMSNDDIVARENAWKEKLGARARGLNSN